jgi:hypothetical protein
VARAFLDDGDLFLRQVIQLVHQPVHLPVNGACLVLGGSQCEKRSKNELTCLLAGRSCMPKLDWVGKQYVVNHVDDVPFRLLQRVSESSMGEDSGKT